MNLKGIRVIITGATGMVGEGVLLECLQNEYVEKVLLLNRRHSDLTHEKLSELIVPDFSQLARFKDPLVGYDACFYCAGKSSNGMSEKDYTAVTYDNTIAVSTVLKDVNPGLVFCFISGRHTDATEKGKTMWARIKGKTENAIIRLFGSNGYNFRPALMKTSPGQKNVYGYNKLTTSRWLYPLLSIFFPSCSIEDIGKAMISVSLNGYSKHTLEVDDIKSAAKNF
jgi:nucleoside-diphosphate-sugar epimerase